MPKTNKGKKSTREKGIEKRISGIVKKLEKLRKSRIFTFFTSYPSSISRNTISVIYKTLRKEFKKTPVLDVIVDSGGGDVDAAYHLAKLFREFAKKKLTFIIPRYAKSAATLLVCGGDEMIMGITSELGPLDPQITDLIKGEQFSPLSIRSTLDLIKQETEESPEIAKMLMDKLQFPLTLGEFMKSLDIGETYLKKLLIGRMFKNDKEKEKKASKIAKSLVKDYPHHGYCIDIEEARNLGLKVKEPPPEEWDLIWKLYELIEGQERKKARKKMEDSLKSLPEPIRKIIEKELRKKTTRKEG